MVVNNEQICRACLPYRRTRTELASTIRPRHHQVHFHFPLTPHQLRIANQLIRVAQRHETTVLHAICGAGKTEMVSLAIADTLNRGGRVGFAIPRQALVRDIAHRFTHLFPSTHVIAVYGGHHDALEGDIIVFTTHQADRYRDSFELVIIDEVDAFPYANNTVLQSLTLHTSKGAVIQLSATPGEELIVAHPRLQLEQRPHGHPQVVPRVIVGSKWHRGWQLTRRLVHWRPHYPILLFVPSIQQATKWYGLLKRWFPSVYLFYAGSPQLKQLPHLIHEKTNFIAVTTTVMERGLTIPRVRVIIWDADHRLFTASTLIQIAGRVGRSSLDYGGETIFLAAHKTQEIESCITTISNQNKSLVDSVEATSPRWNIPSSSFDFLP